MNATRQCPEIAVKRFVPPSSAAVTDNHQSLAKCSCRAAGESEECNLCSDESRGPWRNSSSESFSGTARFAYPKFCHRARER